MTGLAFGKRIVTGVLILLLLSVFTPPPLIPPVSSQATESLTLAVTPAPGTIPADGSEYQIVVIQIRNSTGFPVPAPTDIPVVLSSSKLEVGIVEESVTIPTGSTYTIAKFRTTTTSGTTTVTAAATGFTIGTSSVTTIDPSSSPMKLVVELAPKQLPPETSATGIVVVHLQDTNGVLARASDPILVSLSSSLPSIATVDPSIRIEAGQSYGQASFYATFTPGTTTITASASGYATGSDVLTIKGSTPTKLAVYSAPPQIPERAGANTTITVQLQDANGAPVRAPADVRVAITASNTTVGSIDQPQITIRSGETDAVTYFLSRFAGTASITATAQKYDSDFTDVTVVRAGLAERGQLEIYIAPPAVLPDDRAHRSVYVQLKDFSGQTVRASRDITVHLASSNTAIGSIDTDIIIPSGLTYGAATFYSTHAAGSTTITSSATDFITASTILDVAGAVPSQITVDVVPTQIPSDGLSHPSIVLQLQDVNREPVNAPSDLMVTLSSSRTDIGSVDGTVVLPSGKSTAMATFYSTLVAGSTVITASASGYISSSTDAKTVEPTPSTLAVIASPGILPADGEAYDAIVIQIQDANGVPARARKDIPISISSSTAAIGEIDRSIILREGETFVRAPFHTSSRPGTTTITVLASGFAGSSSKLTTILHPLSLEFSPVDVTINVTDIASIRLSVRSSGAPVPDATVTWRTVNGTLLNASPTTDLSGSATADFRNSAAGSAAVTAVVSKLGFQSASGSTTIETLPLQLRTILSSAPAAVVSEPLEIGVTVLSGDQPVSNATLGWSASIGTFARTSRVTDSDGVGTAVFFSNEEGSAVINVTSSKEGYTVVSASLSITIQPTVATTTQTSSTEQPAFTFLGLDFVVVLALLAVIVAVVVGIVFFMIRRMRRRGGGEGGEEGELEDILGEG